MDDKLTLLTAVRRYLYERDPRLWRARWEETHAPEWGDAGTAGDTSAIVPDIGLDVLHDILYEVESLDPSQFPNAEALRARILEAGRHSPFPAVHYEPADDVREAEERERTLFYRYVAHADASPGEIVPLPHRRVLFAVEGERLWDRVAARWRIADLDAWRWCDHAGTEDVTCFYKDAFERAVPPSEFRRVLMERGVRDVWKLDPHNWEDAYDMDVTFFDGHCEWDCYWTSPDMDWIMYVSHEDLVAIEGRWLLAEIPRIWPELRHSEYKEAFPDWPPPFR